MQKERVGAKNALESYCYNMKQTMEDEKLAAGKISNEDRELVLAAVTECLKWLDANQAAEKQEYEYKLKTVEQTCNPVVIKLYKTEEQQSKPAEGPKIDEVD
jgi:heat shock protein 1/8